MTTTTKSPTQIKRTAGALFVLECEAASSRSEILRRNLLEAGLAKGTVCKIVKIVEGLDSKSITKDDVTSINHAYNLVSGNRKIDLTKLSNKELHELLTQGFAEIERRGVA